MDLTKENSKYCFHCHTIKLFNDFSKDKSTKSGYDNYCKVCKKIKNKKYYSNKIIKIDSAKLESENNKKDIV